MKKIVLALLSLTLVFVLGACGQKNSAVSKEKLVLGTSADYPPYEFHKSINGKDTIIGFDISIAEEVAKDMGKTLEIKDMKFDGLLAALQAGTVDMVLAGFSPTEERKQNVDFSNIYYTASQVVVVRTEDKDKYNSLADLKGKKIGVQKGSIQERLAGEQIENADLKPLGKISDITLQLTSKKVDAIILELPLAKFYTERQKEMSLANVELKVEEAGSAIAIKKGNQTFVDQVNKTLDRLIKEGKIDQFVTEANKQAEDN
ncbi:transporter substrate-binding domain-containing protein [Paenibacillus sp. N1-5-1-14]|uniref:transporter substrate-binding domain-containing protein n=1 Tax=Paenibacillus radicibacter TaxID=2972488 RepID=UPI0021593A98|nr:transporter substrate-binding domain-containing protein [Paenibacillus radicibacter]MCR8641327.1 transporter substrate-binding domain-containing protein [Paenibacillus radicibacter]